MMIFSRLSIKFFCLGIGVWFSIILGGCATGMHQATTPVRSPDNEAVGLAPLPKRPEGTIWQADSILSDLFVNVKARRIGDIITIKIVETSSASNKATTNTGRKSSLTGQIEAFFNLEKKYASNSNNFNPFAKISGGLDSTFEGNGTTSRSGDLSAYITAKVVNVLSNGNLEILGTREIQINNEKQYIMLSGLIRPRDISPENIILSTYISDARIAYSGNGVIHDRQRPGWVARILDKTWPF